MEVTDYVKYEGLRKMTLDSLYEGNEKTLNDLMDNIKNIVDVEAPVTLNTIKARLREAFGVAKISQRCLDIIMKDIHELGLVSSDNLYDQAYWPQSGIFEVKKFRDSGRLIYDIPYQELVLVARQYDCKGEELYRSILSYFGLEVLTKKAEGYLKFIEEKR